jgi:hypothetical protein
MIPIDRPGIDRHFIGPRYLPQQLRCALANVSNQNRIPAFRDPNQMVLAVPDRVTAALIILHFGRIASKPAKSPALPEGRIRPNYKTPAISAGADACFELYDSANWLGFAPPRAPAFTPPLMVWTAPPQRHQSAKAWSLERHKEGDRP